MRVETSRVGRLHAGSSRQHVASGSDAAADRTANNQQQQAAGLYCTSRLCTASSIERRMSRQAGGIGSQILQLGKVGRFFTDRQQQKGVGGFRAVQHTRILHMIWHR
jgi:hypothetical protein